MAIVGHASDPSPIVDTAFMSEAPAQNTIARSIAGRPRWLYEVLTGTNPFADEQPASAKNPQGALGHDHTGGLNGSCFLHPVASWSFQKADTTVLLQPAHPLSEFTGHRRIGPWYFWNRPHQHLADAFGVSPYSRLFLYAIVRKKGANKTLSIDISRITGAAGIDNPKTVSVSVTSTTPTGVVFSSEYLTATGGRNGVLLDFSTNATSSADALSVDAVALCQIVKRRHT
jgi:hypothetical protein